MLPFLLAGLGLLVVIDLTVRLFLGPPYMPSRPETMERMLHLLKVRPGERVVDLGSGDGRLVIALARAGAEAHGYELNLPLVWRARRAIRAAGLEERAYIHWGNFWRTDFSRFDAVVIYGMGYIMSRLEKKLYHELAVGGRVVSNGFALPGWPIARQDKRVYLYRKEDDCDKIAKRGPMENGQIGRDWGRFLAIGLLFTLGGEVFIRVFVLRQFPIALFVVLLLFYGGYVSLEWFGLSRLEQWVLAARASLHHRRLALLGYWLGFTLTGYLAIEWAALGHSREIPLVQASMFGFWSAATLMPAMLTDPNWPVDQKQRVRREILVWLVVLLLLALMLEAVGFEGGRGAALYLGFMVFTIWLQLPCLRYVYWVWRG